MVYINTQVGSLLLAIEFFFSVGDCKHSVLFVAVCNESVPGGGAIKQGVKHNQLEFIIALLRRGSNELLCLSHAS